MRILILFFLAFGILFAQEDLGLQEDIDVNYKRMAREKKKVIIPEIVGLKAADQKKLFDRSSKTYVEFPISSENKPTIVIKTPVGHLYSERWRILTCTDLGQSLESKYVHIKNMKTIVRVIYKDEKSEILRENNRIYDMEGYDSIAIIADNIDIHAGHSDHSKNSVKHYLIEIYIQDVFRKENKNLCVSEILPFDS
ncbi:hypothetical protein [Leptospira interrogans]|uniref:hypothetical protein n=1 Tax=Leptospira interrogans TaxID=173 RepID=UPI000773CDCD|nr:hypothetical protein [Leptospira interrogans]